MIYAISLIFRTSPKERKVVVIVNTEAPQEIIDLFIEEFALGKVTAQSKGMTKGTIAYENGIIMYEAKS